MIASGMRRNSSKTSRAWEPTRSKACGQMTCSERCLRRWQRREACRQRSPVCSERWVAWEEVVCRASRWAGSLAAVVCRSASARWARAVACNSRAVGRGVATNAGRSHVHPWRIFSARRGRQTGKGLSQKSCHSTTCAGLSAKRCFSFSFSSTY
jgi:hypothetical protein